MTIDGETIDSSAGHPYYVVDRGFVHAQDLKAGDKVLLLDGTITEIENVEIEHREEPVKIYNFEVEDWHTYYVSESGVLVHNRDCGKTKLRDTRNIRFSQSSISSTFDDGSSVNDLIYHFKNSPDYAANIEPIRLVKYKDLPSEVQNYLSVQNVSPSTVFSLDNRRLYAAKIAKVKINSIWASSEDIKNINMVKRFSTVTGGKSIKVK